MHTYKTKINTYKLNDGTWRYNLVFTHRYDMKAAVGPPISISYKIKKEAVFQARQHKNHVLSIDGYNPFQI